jgi:soluble lytic murein transglycosylase
VPLAFVHLALITSLGGTPRSVGPGDGAPVHAATAARPVIGDGRGNAAALRYLEAANAFPSLGEWMIRRAALTTTDSLERRALYSRIHSPIVLARLLETEAVARENTGDLRGAALRYDSLGRVIDATRLRLAVATRPAERTALRETLVAFAEQRAGTPEVQDAIDLLFDSKLVPTAQEALILARAASKSRLASRAVTLFPRAIASGLATPADRLAYGLVLAQVGRHREAIAVLRRVPPGSASALEAAYQQAVSLNRMGQRMPALAILKRLGQDEDSALATKALFLAGDINWRANQDDQARAAWLTLVRRFPLRELAPRAAFLAALVQWENGHQLDAAEEWERTHQVYGGQDGLAAGYWAGRAFDEAGQHRRAEGLWQSVLARDSLSYYAVASFRRLGIEPWTPPPAPDRFESFTDLDSLASRLAGLRSLSMTQEIEWERDWLLADRRRQPERMLAAADLLRRDGQAAASVTLARRALLTGAPADARTYRLIFPLLHSEELQAEAGAAGVDKSLVAALIRQESIWEPAARSRTGAIGLMQVMPATGREIARTLKVTRWSAEALLDPATNIRFGTYHLAAVLRRFEGDLARALAAYNAGASRVTTWNGTGPARDPELFVERITIPETRDYVRIIQRNLMLYKALYGEGSWPLAVSR